MIPFKYIFLLLLFPLLPGCRMPAGSDEGGDISESGLDGDDVASVLSENAASHEESGDYTYDESDVVDITLDDSGAVFSSPSVSWSSGNSRLTISEAGVYRLTGSLSEGRIKVDNDEGIAGTVRLILNGLSVTSSAGSPLSIKEGDKALIELAGGTANALTDISEYGSDDDPDPVLYSKVDTTIYGTGSLTVVSDDYQQGIGCSDGLLIKEGTIYVTSWDDGIKGKDYLIVEGGALTVSSAEEDGLKSNNDEEEECGYILIAGGTLTITAGSDGIQAETDLLVTGGDLTVTAGGGSTGSVGDDESAKALKAGVCLITEGGAFTLDAAEDALHSDNRIVITEGDFTIAAGDDGIHSDTALEINGGTVEITSSYEAMESALIIINGGDLDVTASDDGINAAGDSTNYLYIKGGRIAVDSSGDGIDVNGSALMTGGTVIVNGPTSSGDGSVDYDDTFLISGGLLIAAGSSRMAENVSGGSEQCSALITFSAAQSADTMLHLESASGTDLFTFAPTKSIQSLVISSPGLSKGTSYVLYRGGSYSGGSEDNGYYQGGSYTGGSSYATWTQSSTVMGVSSGGSSPLR